jgi:hypothetical protein
MRWMEPLQIRIEVMDTARRVLRNRNSGRINRLTSARNDVRSLLVEGRRFRAEAEAVLVKDGIAITETVRGLLLAVWSDMLNAHQLRAA